MSIKQLVKANSLAVACIFPLLTTSAAALEGRVVKVVDGDTLVIFTAKNQQIRVRLTEIDAPEQRQAYGRKAKEQLASFCAGKKAVLTDTGTDRYGRTLGRVHCDSIDANLQMVTTGYAWRYTKYARDPALVVAQDSAQRMKLGLWADDNPIPPWDFRKRK